MPKATEESLLQRVESIRSYFQERHGLKVNIDIRVHSERPVRNDKGHFLSSVSQKTSPFLADRIAAAAGIAPECVAHVMFEGDGVDHIGASNMPLEDYGYGDRVTVFYKSDQELLELFEWLPYIHK